MYYLTKVWNTNLIKTDCKSILSLSNNNRPVLYTIVRSMFDWGRGCMCSFVCVCDSRDKGVDEVLTLRALANGRMETQLLCRLCFSGRWKKFLKTINWKGIDFQISFETKIVKDGRKDVRKKKRYI